MHLQCSHSVADFVTRRAGVLKGCRVVSRLHMVPDVLSAAVCELVAEPARPFPLRLVPDAELEQVLRGGHRRHRLPRPWIEIRFVEDENPIC